MLDKWFKAPVHYYLYLIALSLIAVGLSSSKVLMSIGTICLIVNSLLEGQLKLKMDRLKKDPALIIIILFLLFSILTLGWSDNWNYGLDDLRKKLPFFIIPIVMGTSNPLKKEHFKLIIYLFVTALVLFSGINYFSYIQQLTEIKDVREMSKFLSHVRLSLLINIGIFISGYYLYKEFRQNYLLILALVWLVFYQYKSQVINGYALFLGLSFITALFLVRQLKSKLLRRFIYSFTIVLGVVLVVFLGRFIKQAPAVEQVDFSNLTLYTANHNGYYHLKDANIMENGKLVYLYISTKECRKAWNKRSDMAFDGLDKRGQKLEGTLYRYMTSKGLRKDSVGFLSLHNRDIQLIENGHSNFNVNKGFLEKLSDLKMQWYTLQTKGDPNGNSIIQRKIHLETGLSILKNNWLFGVGIGDVDDEFRRQYRVDDSLLKKENQHRSHNQFLTIWISHGIFGWILILSLFIVPVVQGKARNYCSIVILFSLFLSFLTQDMLETQAGVTIFGFFYSLFVINQNIDGKDR
ncbi:hypothetical protein DNU06_13610 [Putridiphycobacter roseus]|uniref:O-antigen ligase-related domain-containing protein n=1 Tax=Putridiphycobacter roseus TaxID=2219161 RepID=A0A2W1NAL3_9FLAO|nr:O-antigen ligase family protein [Putridiphycobacter roseus]PZE16345.1 hypothetical protein DNU06_13610 [Putridiphycobacter roseus]